MNRRAFFGRATATATTTTTAGVTTLSPYNGPWEIAQASHLLRRATFGPTPAQVNQAVAEGLSVTIGALFAPVLALDPPVYYNFENDPNVANGETWVNTPAPIPNVPNLQGNRRRSLRAWQFGVFQNEEVSVRQKTALFWHNHFAVNNINNGREGYQYLHVLHTHALGNFRTLVEEITVAPGMLRFLNGHQNSRQAPNENYSRELLELFTIGRGDAAGPGDYTNYTEDDVVEMARALTGWRATPIAEGLASSTFVNNRHDTEDKQLSHRFDDAIITDAGAEEYKVVIDHILQQPEVARFLARQLHIWFVGTDIDGLVEMNIIEPMAQLILDNDYEIQPALEALLSSEYFFAEEHRGCMVSHPLDFIFRIIKSFTITSEAPLLQQYRFWDRINRFVADQGMAIMELPSVAGWPAFYQSPQYYQFWINSVTLPKRQSLADAMLNGINVAGFRWELQLLDFIAEIEGNVDPNALIEGISAYLFAAPLGQNQ
ncbi:MAG: DUF1800 family protein [Bacteroidota bacterium]